MLIIPSSWGFPTGPVRHQAAAPPDPLRAGIAAVSCRCYKDDYSLLISYYIRNSVLKSTRYNPKIKEFCKNKGYSPNMGEQYRHNDIQK
jgi:hypothetical protein